jgi:hypothetical protein
VSSAEYSGHSEKLSDAYVGNMFDENGNPVLARAATTERAERFAESGKGRWPRYSVGGRVKVIRTGNVRTEPMPVNVIILLAAPRIHRRCGFEGPKGMTGFHDALCLPALRTAYVGLSK